jgi:hypothetical protein
MPTSLKLEKMAAKVAVGVPVHKRLEAEVIMARKDSTICSLRPPCTKSQFRQPTQSEKKEPPHMHSAWARR